MSKDINVAENSVGVAIEDEKLLVAIRITNSGRTAVRDVQLTRINLQNKKLLKPATLPLHIGTMAAGKHAIVQLAFTSRVSRQGGRTYRLTMQGLSHAGNFQLRCLVTIPVPNGQQIARHTAAIQRTSGVLLLPDRTPVCVEEESEDEDKYPPLPDGKLIGALGPHGSPYKVLKWGGEGIPEPNTGVTVIRSGSTSLDLSIDRKGGFPVDPSGACVDLKSITGGVTQLVILTGNLYALISLDGGVTFKHLDPTTIFGNIPLDGLPKDRGLCCDMNLIYIPSIDRVVWPILTRGSLIDSTKPDTSLSHWNRLRVAFASPQQIVDSGGTSWSYWDMTTATFGLNNQNAFLDYPDIHFTAENVYFSITATDEWRLLVIRVPLKDLQGDGTIHIGFTDPDTGKNAAGARLVHYSPDAGYWARHDTSSQLVVFEWPDGSDTYSWRTVPIDKWRDDDIPDDFTSLTPEGTNWLDKNSTAIRGGTVQGEFKGLADSVNRRIVFAWNAPRTKGVPQPHVRIQPILRKTAAGNVTWVAEPSSDIWNPDFAFHHAHLASNPNGEVGISVAAGGSASEATPVAGFLGDAKLYRLGVSTTSADIWGDYTAIRRHWPKERYFAVSDYYLLGPKSKLVVRAQYRMFARPADVT